MHDFKKLYANMKTDVFHVSNINCKNCESTIKEKMSALPGVEIVIVEKNVVKIQHAGILDISVLIKTLESIGYPLETETII